MPKKISSPEFNTADWHDLYINQGKTLQQLADMFGCSAFPIKIAIKESGVKLRGGGNVKGKPLPERVIISKDDLIDLYENKKQSSDEIAEKFGCSGVTVLSRLRKHGIRIRQHNETKRGKPSNRRINLDTQLIVELYMENNMSISHISKQFGVDDNVIKRHLQSACIKIKPISFYAKKRTGKNNPNYKGGIKVVNLSIRESSKNARWRERVFKKDGYTCKCCGDSRGGNLNAHHIENFAECREKRFKASNGITLCVSCHMAFHKEYGYRKNTSQQLVEFLESRQLPIAEIQEIYR